MCRSQSEGGRRCGGASVPATSRRDAELSAFRARSRNYTRTDDDATYVVESGGVKFTVKGINSAKAVAGKTGTITKK